MSDSLQVILHKEITQAKEIGEGGFGKVYKGSWNGYDVAIKILRLKQLNDDLVEEFTREARVMAKLNNPAIIRLYGICKEPGKYAMVMELMPKGDLYHLLSDQKQTLPWKLRWQLATDIGSGLAYLHKNNIIHRDLKSLNILLDHNSRAKITDFGLSKLRQQSNTLYTTSVKGSIAWMAPELFGRQPKITPKADVFAYGVVLWEIATRKLPFADAINPSLIAVWVQQGEREDIPKDCPKAYADTITHCWQQDADKRPTVLEALEMLGGKEPPPIPEPLVNTITKITSPQPKAPQSSFDFEKWGCIRTLEGHTKAVTALQPLKNGRLASGSEDGTVKIWDFTSQNNPIKHSFSISDSVIALALLDNGNLAGSTKGTTYIWNTKEYQRVLTLNSPTPEHDNNPHNVSSLTVLPQSRLAAGFSYYKIRIWDTVKGIDLVTIDTKQDSDYYNGITNTLCVLPNGNLAAQQAGSILIWDLEIKKMVGKFSATASTAILLSTNIIACGSRDGTIKIWDCRKYKCLKILSGHRTLVSSLVKLSPQYLASGSHDETIKIWNIENAHCVATLKGHSDSIQALTLLSNGCLVSSSIDSTIKLWGPINMKLPPEMKMHEKLRLVSVVPFKPSGSQIVNVFLESNFYVSGHFFGAEQIQIWDLKNGQSVKSLKQSDHQLSNINVIALPNLKLAIIGKEAQGGPNKQVKIYDFNKERIVGTFKYPVRWCWFSNQFIFDAKDKTRVWNHVKGQHKTLSKSFAFSAAATNLSETLALGSGREILIFKPGVFFGYNKSFALQGHYTKVTKLLFFKENHLISGSENGTIKIWDLQIKKNIATLTGHRGRIKKLLVLRGDLLASSAMDDSVRVWDLSTYQSVGRIRGFGGYAELGLLANGDLLTMGSKIEIWRYTD